MIRRGFTLLEIMVSLMIFSVVSLALIGVLNAAVKLFRAGESARAANDETIAALTQLDDDLKRMVPAADGGFFFTKTKKTLAHQCGNMLLAFKIRNPDSRDIGTNGNRARLVVVWWVGDDGKLNRGVQTAADSDGATNTISEYDVAANIYGSSPAPIANGCLYFGVDLSVDSVDPLTPSVSRVRNNLEWQSHIPDSNEIYSTEAFPDHLTIDAFPSAMRITAVLTGGSRNVMRGHVVRAQGDDLRVSGVGQVPVTSGAMARIGDPKSSEVEWVTYTSFAHGILACSAGREQRRTSRIPAGDIIGLDVTFAPSYSLVRTLPR